MNENFRSRWPIPTSTPEELDPELSFQIARRTTILIVDDEAHVRGLAKRVLSGQAYRVRDAANGLAAIAVAESEGGIDLILTDVEMPAIGVRRMLRRLRQLNPEVKVLFMSGYSDHELLSRGFDKGWDPFLDKPFSGSQLVAAVREVLAAPSVQHV
jgi:two-component system, cell cycle sensor histidine kinase and response regulator CckA